MSLTTLPITFQPIVQRELRLASRHGRTYWVRLGAACVAGVTALGILSPSFRGLQSPSASGASLFLVLSAGAFALCLLAGTFITADCLSEEKREGTLGLLLLTHLNAYDIILGKLVATSLNAFYALIAALPMLALPLMLGGVTPGEFWRMALVLTNTLFFSLAAGMCVSALVRNGYMAVAGTLMVIVLITVFPLLGVAINPFGKPAPEVLALSPAYAGYLAFQSRFAANAGWYWLSNLFTHAMAWALLFAAAKFLPKFWQDKAGPSLNWQWIFPRRKLEHWKEEHKESLAANPILWLARREQYRYALFWGFVGLAALAWLAGYWQFKAAWLRAEVVFATTSMLHLVIKCWLALEASRRLAESRRSGELELLLVSPVSVAEILNGRILALKRQFFTPIAVVVAVDIWLVLFCVSSPGWWGSSAIWGLALVAGCAMFLADTYTITWTGLWLGLTARNPTYAFMNTLAKVLLMPWLIYLVSLAVLGPIFGPGDWTILWWLIVGVGNCLALCTWANNRLQEEFREAATETLAPKPLGSNWQRLMAGSEAEIPNEAPNRP